MPLKIRAIDANDMYEVSRLVRSLSYYYIKSHEHSLPDWFSELLTFEAFVERYHSNQYASFVYEKSGNIHGYLSIKKPNVIYHFFVAEAVHNKGVGTQLWEYAKKELALDEQPILTLRSSLTAVNFYEKIGFSCVGEVDEKDGICYQPMQLRQNNDCKR